MTSSCIKLEDLSLWADEDEPRTLYPHDIVQKLKNENARLKKENEQFYNDNEELRKKLAEYEQVWFGFIPKGKIETVHLESPEYARNLPPEPIKPKITSGSIEFKNNDTADEIKKNVTSLNLSLDCVSALGIVYEEDREEKTQEVNLKNLALEVLQKQNEELQEEKDKPDDDKTINLKINPEQHWERVRNFAPPFTSVSKAEMYSSDGEKIAETKTNKSDNYDDIIK